MELKKYFKKRLQGVLRMSISLYKQYENQCRENGVSRSNFKNRLKLGWSPEKAATTQEKRHPIKEKDLEIPPKREITRK